MICGAFGICHLHSSKLWSNSVSRNHWARQTINWRFTPSLPISNRLIGTESRCSRPSGTCAFCPMDNITPLQENMFGVAPHRWNFGRKRKPLWVVFPLEIFPLVCRLDVHPFITIWTQFLRSILSASDNYYPTIGGSTDDFGPFG